MEPVRWSRVLAALLTLLLLFEGFAQVFMYVWAEEPFRSLQAMVWSPYGLVRNNPRLTSPNFKHTEQGFRNTGTFAEQKPPRTLRVILLGASVLYGAVTPTENTRADEARTGSDETIATYLEALLKADPALEGLDVEVINAGVSFNRYVESASAYLTEYVFWQPDVVVVLGSYNNIGEDPARGIYDERRGRLMRPHPWRLQFDREVNDLSFAGLVGRGVRTLADGSALTALTAKGLDKSIDLGFRVAGGMARRLFGSRPSSLPPAAEPGEVERVADALLGHVEAMVAAARHHDQHIAFFWEYLFADIREFKQLSPGADDPRARYSELRLDGDRTDRRRRAHFYYLDRLRRALQRPGATFIDPFRELMTTEERVFVDYLHYTPAGNRLAARVIHDRLRPVFAEQAARLHAAGAGADVMSGRDVR